MISDVDNLGISASDYFKNIIKDDIKVFKELTGVSLEQRNNYKEIKDKLDKTTNIKQKGILLESLSKMIINDTYFFKVHSNVITQTNEIDLIVVPTDDGIQAIKRFNLNEQLLKIPYKTFISECKNYKKNVGVTWIGKFYSLMSVCNCKFGIIFSNKKLTGSEEYWTDGNGLIRVLNLIENTKGTDNFSMINLNSEDYDRLIQGERFFDLIGNKINSVRFASKYESFIEDNKHEKREEIKEIVTKLNA